MRRFVGAIVVTAVALLAVGASPAFAAPPATPAGGGVVAGLWQPYPTGMYSCCETQVDLSFAGALPIATSSYLGVFDVSGWAATYGYIPHGPQPCLPVPMTCLLATPPDLVQHPFTASLGLAGSNALGDAIAGTCGLPGSSTGLAEIVFVCSVALDGGPPAQVTLAMATARANPIAQNQVQGAWLS